MVHPPRLPTAGQDSFPQTGFAGRRRGECFLFSLKKDILERR